VAGNLGNATSAASNLVFDGGTLQYTGENASTDRSFIINTGKTAFIAVASNNLTMSGASTSTSGALTKTGGGTLILSGANLHSGTTSVNGGKLFVNGSLANSAVVVGSGATLGGTGALGHGATINSGGHLAPGDSSTGNGVGTLTFTGGLTLQAGAFYDFQLGSSSDKIVVSGGTLAGLTSGTVTLNLSTATGFTTGTYTLFDFTGATNSNFDAGDFGFGTTISGYNGSLSISGTTLVLTATAIPEPATDAVLLAFASIGAVAWRRRRTG